jgi:hypothetical protein
MKRAVLLVSLALAASSLTLAAGCGGRRHAGKGGGTLGGPANAQLATNADQQAQAASLRRGGVRQGEVLTGQTHGNGESLEFKVTMNADHCYWFSGSANEKIGFYLFDTNGKRVESQTGSPNDILMEYCPSKDGVYKLETKLWRRGELAVAIYEGGKPVAVAAAPAPEPKEAGPTMEDLIAKEAAAAAPGATQVGTFFEGTVDETTWSTSLQAGKCYWFIGAGQTGKVKKLALYVWDPKNNRITVTKAESNVVNVGHCAKETGMFKFQAKVTSGGGPYKVAVYEKH